jgi:hypothetical protein
MGSFETLRLVGSLQVLELFVVLGGLTFMVGLRSAALKLIAAGIVLCIVANLFVYEMQTHGMALFGIPSWLVRPLLLIPLAIVGCWILRGCIALFLGRAVADTVTGDVLAWTIKGLLRAALAPYRAIRFVMHVLPRQTP